MEPLSISKKHYNLTEKEAAAFNDKCWDLYASDPEHPYIINVWLPLKAAYGAPNPLTFTFMQNLGGMHRTSKQAYQRFWHVDCCIEPLLLHTLPFDYHFLPLLQSSIVVRFYFGPGSWMKAPIHL